MLLLSCADFGLTLGWAGADLALASG